MDNWQSRTLNEKSTVKDALAILDQIGVVSNVLFVIDKEGMLLGSVTDGDIRRAFLKDASVKDPVTTVMNSQCKRVENYKLDNDFLADCRSRGMVYLPVVNDGKMVDVINLKSYREIIPVDAVVMAGGKGERLMPLTKDIPKPMLKIDGQPIIEYNIDRLQQFGVQTIYITLNYLGHIIKDYFKDGSAKGVSIKYVEEKKPLGTMGSMSLVDKYENAVILLMNSDLLTNIDFGDFYRDFIKAGADIGVATIPHHVDLPYAFLELQDTVVTSLKEKPRYTYFANAGIYLIKRNLIEKLPKGEFYNATDLMESVLSRGGKVFHYPILGYWLDIGRMNDYFKAQEDVKHIYW